MEYSVEFREQVIEKALSSGQGQEVLAEECGIGRSTLQKWLRDYRNSGVLSLAKQEKRPADWSVDYVLRGGRRTPVRDDGRLFAERVGGDYTVAGQTALYSVIVKARCRIAYDNIRALPG